MGVRTMNPREYMNLCEKSDRRRHSDTHCTAGGRGFKPRPSYYSMTSFSSTRLLEAVALTIGSVPRETVFEFRQFA